MDDTTNGMMNTEEDKTPDAPAAGGMDAASSDDAVDTTKDPMDETTGDNLAVDDAEPKLNSAGDVDEEDEDEEDDDDKDPETEMPA